MTPDGYISYLAVRSGWARAGVGRFMLWWLVQAAGGKDVGLHVSANNRAMVRAHYTTFVRGRGLTQVGFDSCYTND